MGNDFTILVLVRGKVDECGVISGVGSRDIMESRRYVIQYGRAIHQGSSFISEDVSGDKAFGTGFSYETELLVGRHKLGFEVRIGFCSLWILVPIVDSDVESYLGCNYLEGDAGDVLVGHAAEYGFLIGNAVIYFLEEYGEGCLWGLFCGY